MGPQPARGRRTPSSRILRHSVAPPAAMGGDGQGITGYETRMSQWALDAGIAYRY